MRNITTSLKLAGLTLTLCCVAYPLTVLILARVIDRDKADGSLIRSKTGEILGSGLIAQEFTSPRYFWPRPSATGFNGAASGGSNLAPANPELTARAVEIMGRLGIDGDNPIPADLLTASGSGLDPHISESAAYLQAPRVAGARGVPLEAINRKIDSLAFSPGGYLTPDRIVNVLELNLALDEGLPSNTH